MKSRDATSLSGSRAGITLMFAANGLVVGTFAASIPRIVERLGLSPAAIAIALFASSLGAVAGMPFVGRAIDRFGGRPVAIAGASFVPVLLPVVAEAPSFVQLVVAGFFFGLTIGIFDVGMNAYAVAAEHAAGASWIAQVHGAWSVGNVTGTVLLVGLVARGVPLPSVVTSCALVIVIICYTLIAPPVGHEVDLATSAAPKRALITLGVLAAFALSIEGSMADWAPLYVQRDLNVSVVYAPLAYAAFSFAMTLTRFVGDALITRFGRIAVLGASGALAATSLGIALVLPNFASAAIAFAFAGVGCANLAPTLFILGGRIGAGAGMATVTGIGYSAFLAGPALLGTTAQMAGLRAALGIAVACAAIVAIGSRVPAIRVASDGVGG